MPASISLQPGCFYHSYNRGNNRENIFVEERNYVHFMNLYGKHVQPVAELYAYCLLRNHFHLLVRIRDKEELKELKGQQKDPSRAFSNLFNAYAKAINKAYNRTGSLFQRPFGRIPVTTNSYFLQLIAYIHRNPQKHGFVEDFRDWPYSSYDPHLTGLGDLSGVLRRQEVLDWFSGEVRSFEDFHVTRYDESKVLEFAGDDPD